MLRWLVQTAGWLAVMLAACTGAPVAGTPGGDEAPAPTPAPTAAATGDAGSEPAAGPAGAPGEATPDAAEIELAVDWATRADVIELPGGWSLEGCPGDAPLLCVTDGDDVLGVVEMLDYPVVAGDPPTLPARVEDFYDWVAADRREGCGPGYGVSTDPVRDVEFGGHPGLAYGFTGSDARGNETERTLAYMTEVDGTVYVLNAAAYADAPCPGRNPEGQEFVPGDLAALAPHLDALARGSVLPGS